MTLPNLLIIGAQKASTSSLHRYLDAHPDIAMSQPKELNYFAGPGWNWDRGQRWYESHFTSDAAVLGESSPSYTAFPWVQDVPERIRAVVPQVKLVYLVRDPIERILSHYAHRRARGAERQSLAEVFGDPNFHGSGYVALSRYFQQLERYLACFEPERILVVAQEDLLTEREATLRRVLAFLGVDESFTSPAWADPHNVPVDFPLRRALGKVLSPRAVRRVMRLGLSRLDRPRRLTTRPQIAADLRARAAELLAPDAERLRSFTGEHYRSWSV